MVGCARLTSRLLRWQVAEHVSFNQGLRALGATLLISPSLINWTTATSPCVQTPKLGATLVLELFSTTLPQSFGAGCRNSLVLDTKVCDFYEAPNASQVCDGVLPRFVRLNCPLDV